MARPYFIVAALTLFAPVPVVEAQTATPPKGHVFVLGGFAKLPDHSDAFNPVPQGSSPAIQVGGGWMLSRDVGIEVEFVTARETEASTDWFGRPSIQQRRRSVHRDAFITPLIRLRVFQNERGAVDLVAGVGWARERLDYEIHTRGGIPPMPFPYPDTHTLTTARRNAAVLSFGGDGTRWFVRNIGLTVSGKMRVTDRDESFGVHVPSVSFTAGAGLRVGF